MSKVMLIEDDVVVVDLLRTLLSLEGHDIVIFSIEEDIVESIKQNKPDVVLMDVYLRSSPDADKEGLRMLRQIRAAPELAYTKVIMSSGLDFHIESKQAGADGFLHKPYMPEDLINLITDVTHRPAGST